MIGLVFIDDEYLVREGLRTIEWEKYGIELQGMAEDGMSALKLIREKNPDIVLTDIRMPGMSGLKLLQVLKNENPSIKGILISGFKDFEYAHAAIKVGAYDYIMKPTNPEEIIEVVTNVKKRIEEELSKKITTKTLTKKLKVTEDMLYNSLINNIMVKKYFDKKNIYSNLSLLNITLKAFAVVGYKLDNSNKTIEPQIMEIIETVTREKDPLITSYIIRVSNNIFFSLIEVSKIDEENRENTIKNIVENVRGNLERNMQITSLIFISKIIFDIEDINKQYKYILNCLNFRFIEKNNLTINKNFISTGNADNNKLLIERINEIISNIKLINYYKVKELVDNFMYRLSNEMKGNEQFIKEMSVHLVISSINEINGYKKLNGEDICRDIDNCDDIYLLTDLIKNLLNELMDEIKNNSKMPSNMIVESIIEYIGENYMKEITLAEVSEYVHMNPVYISRLIKQEKNYGFVEILTQVRIQKASELIIKSDYRVYEICEKVGFKNSRYFSEVFKKYMGITPTEYKQSIH